MLTPVLILAATFVAGFFAGFAARSLRSHQRRARHRVYAPHVAPPPANSSRRPVSAFGHVRRAFQFEGRRRGNLDSMRDLRGQSPRRYVADVSGRRVLVGLTLEETSEFEDLDTSLPTLHGRDEPGVGLVTPVEGRWLELYDKHDKAWIKWKADLRAGEQGNSPFFN